MRVGKVSDWTKPGEELFLKGIRLKPMQIAIINCNKGSNVLVNLPTGFGKSLLFQYPASHLERKCIIVFVPLKALLWDCLKQAELLDISSSELTPAFIKKYHKNSVLPQLLFLTPERLFSTGNGVLSFVDMLYYQDLIELMVIDEAHCISEWGSDFRPDYSKLCQLRTMFPNIRLLGMSATIPHQARQDLVDRLKIPGSYYFQSSSNRSNLIYSIKTVEKANICSQILHFLDQKDLKGSSGIIYCQTIKSCEDIYQKLSKLRFDCCLFHSKLTEKQRSSNFQGFMNEEIKVIVATICFGMGVNKKNIRFVVNVGVSLSAENYYQESGRAGRDGEPSHCLLLSYKADVSPLEYLINESSKKEVLKRRRIYKLSQIKNYTKSNQCRKKHLFALLGEEFTPEQCKKTCDFCQNGLTSECIEIDFTQKSLKLMRELSGLKVKLTKIQLQNLLKGRQPNIADKLTKEKTKVLAGMLKQEKIETIDLMIDTLLQEKLLVKFYYFSKGRFKRKIEYLVPCNKTDLKNKKGPIMLKIITTKSTEPVLDINKPVNKTSSFAQKFEKYLSTKNSQNDNHFHDGFSPSLHKKNKSEDLGNYTDKPQPKVETKKEADKKAFPKEADQELQEIKMVPMSVDYQRFFEDLFASQLEEDIEAEAIDIVNRDKEHRGEEEVRQSEFQTYEDEELEHPIFEPPRKQEYEKQQDAKDNASSEDESFDSEFVEMIRKKKEELARKKALLQQKKPVIRLQMAKKIDFL